MYQDSNMLASIRKVEAAREENIKLDPCLLYTSPSPRD